MGAGPSPHDGCNRSGSGARSGRRDIHHGFPLVEELKIRCWTGLAVTALRLLGWTTRKSHVNADEILACWGRQEQIILAFWHSRILLMPFSYRGKQTCILNSIHRDGEIITRVLRRFRVAVVRGSSSRGWLGGFRGLVEAYQQGYDLIVVPDGPRGPRCRAKSGIVQLARVTGAPIFPVTYSAAWHARLGSWDRLMIPFPFSHVTFVVGPSIRVPRTISAEELEAKRLELELSLRAITTQADECYTERRREAKS